VQWNFRRRAAATGKRSVADSGHRRVRRTSRDVDEVERNRRLDSVSAGRRSSSGRYVGARPCWLGGAENAGRENDGREIDGSVCRA